MDYDTWKTGFNESTETLKDNGYIHKNDLPNFDDVRDYLSGVVEGYQNCDNEKLERCIEELCAIFKVDF